MIRIVRLNRGPFAWSTGFRSGVAETWAEAWEAVQQ